MYLEARGGSDHIVALLALLVKDDDAALLDRHNTGCARDDLRSNEGRHAVASALLGLGSRSQDCAGLHLLAVLDEHLGTLGERELVAIHLDAGDFDASGVAVTADLNDAVDLRDLGGSLGHSRLE